MRVVANQSKHKTARSAASPVRGVMSGQISCACHALYAAHRPPRRAQRRCCQRHMLSHARHRHRTVRPAQRAASSRRSLRICEWRSQRRRGTAGRCSTGRPAADCLSARYKRYNARWFAPQPGHIDTPWGERPRGEYACASGRRDRRILAVCTHAGCDEWAWLGAQKMLKCPCHDSEFDPKDGARVNVGPAPRRLPALPLKLVDGVLLAAGSFSARVGFQPA